MAYQQRFPPRDSDIPTRSRPPGSARRGLEPLDAVTYYGPKKTKRRRVRAVLLSLIALVVVLGALLGAAAYIIIQPGNQTFYKGVYVDGIELHGASAEQACEYLQALANEKLRSWKLTLYYSDELKWNITGDMIDMQANIVARVNDAWMQGRVGSIFERAYDIISLRRTPYHASTASVLFNPYSLSALISDIKGQLDLAPVDAARISDSTRTPPFVYIDERAGLLLDADALEADVIGYAQRLESASIPIRMETVEPTVRVADLQNDIVRLSRARTAISSSSTNERNANIDMGCEKFNGLSVAPGAQVSFNDTVGKRTMENGWQEALEIKYGEYVMGYGGGICQVSSTLYNAVVEAGLEVVDRTAHKLAVSYLDPGKDATVADRGTDFVFRNNTDQPIQISARVDKSGSTQYCVFEIFGAPDPSGYSYSLVSEIESKIPPPTEPKQVPDKEGKYVKYIGQTHIVKGESGYEVNSFRVVSKNGTEISRTFIAHDRYEPVSPHEYYGVTPR
ncbi:MAG: VanW family protein [Oscillospiraceae bacterium]|jgi:vancomycin resistance protein YoaR|nr:VanW family protein [Oscillospiraceae bacterium]